MAGRVYRAVVSSTSRWRAPAATVASRFMARPLLGTIAAGSCALLVSAACVGTPVACLSSPPKSHVKRTFIMVKPDGMQRGLAAEVMARFERRGFRLVAARVVVPSKAVAEEHYAEHKGRPFFPALIDFVTSGPVLAMVWEGVEVVKVGRMMIGKTSPRASPPGTIRGDHGTIEVAGCHNVVHGSDSDGAAAREIALWFPDASDIATWPDDALPPQ